MRLMAKVWFFLAASLVATAFTTTYASDEVELPRFDLEDPYDTGVYSYKLSTDSEDEIHFKIRFSNSVNDTFCNKTRSYSQDTVSSSTSVTNSMRFSQMGSPHVALYEWHFCLEVGGVIYRAWRGFDPGPNSSISLKCFLGTARLAAEETDSYLCELRSVKTNPKNYGEYAAVCDATSGDCRRFETADELRLWNSLNADEGLAENLVYAYFVYVTNLPALQGESNPPANRAPIYLSVVGQDPSIELRDRLTELGLEVFPGSAWERGKGTEFSISKIQAISKRSVSAVISTYCGPLCASGSTVVFKRKRGEWLVKSEELNWIS